MTMAMFAIYIITMNYIYITYTPQTEWVSWTGRRKEVQHPLVPYRKDTWRPSSASHRYSLCGKCAYMVKIVEILLIQNHTYILHTWNLEIQSHTIIDITFNYTAKLKYKKYVQAWYVSNLIQGNNKVHCKCNFTSHLDIF